MEGLETILLMSRWWREHGFFSCPYDCMVYHGICIQINIWMHSW